MNRFDFTQPVVANITLYAKWQARPRFKTELTTLINQAISEQGDRPDLNFIDSSLITDMSQLFLSKIKFNGSISNWDISNVTNMSMFSGSRLAGSEPTWCTTGCK